jgi:hypothetical protein
MARDTWKYLANSESIKLRPAFRGIVFWVPDLFIEYVP